MELKDKIIVVTGAGAGIGRALCVAFAAQGAKAIACVDIDMARAEETATLVNGMPFKVDVAQEDEIAAMIAQVEDELGPIDLFCSNAGVLTEGGVEASNTDWQRLWDINVMAHVWAARHLVPRMAARGGGYLLNTASAAGFSLKVRAKSTMMTIAITPGTSQMGIQLWPSPMASPASLSAGYMSATRPAIKIPISMPTP